MCMWPAGGASSSSGAFSDAHCQHIIGRPCCNPPGSRRSSPRRPVHGPAAAACRLSSAAFPRAPTAWRATGATERRCALPCHTTEERRRGLVSATQHSAAPSGLSSPSAMRPEIWTPAWIDLGARLAGRLNQGGSGGSGGRPSAAAVIRLAQVADQTGLYIASCRVTKLN